MPPVKPNPYETFRGRELSVNDHLAISRTILANERTLLAYGRTFLAMLVIGGTLIQLFDTWAALLTGGFFVLGGFITLGIGWWRYLRTRKQLAPLVGLGARVNDREGGAC